MTHAIATEIVDELARALDTLAIVTLDMEEAVNAVNAGRHVVFLQPPDVDYTTDHAIVCTWRIYVIPGESDRIIGWHIIDALVDIIRDAINVTRSTPYDWTPTNQGSPLIAFELTATTHHDL